MSLFHGYVTAKACSGKPQPGVVAFEHAALAAVPESHSDGIYNCRPVRGSITTTSLHGEGRAFDWGCTAGAEWAAEAADFLVETSAQLGIQCVIYNRRIWSGAHPDSGWRPYSGVDNHTTHLHIEFSWAAAEHLTQAQAAHYLEALVKLTDDDIERIAERAAYKVWAYNQGGATAQAWAYQKGIEAIVGRAVLANGLAYKNPKLSQVDVYQQLQDIHAAVTKPKETP